MGPNKIIQHKLIILSASAEDQGERGQKGKHQAALFYTGDDMVASSDPCWIHGEFNTLAGLFDRVGMRTNVGKTVSMVYRPCQASGKQLEAAYGRRVIGEGPTYRESQNVRVHCRKCGE